MWTYRLLWLGSFVGFAAISSCGKDGTRSYFKGSNSRSIPHLTGDRLGVNLHRPMGDEARFLFGKTQELGLGWVRIDVAWDDIEIAKGEYKWSRSDEPIREAASRGLKILANLHATPKWANRNKGSTVAPDRTEDWVDFCEKSSLRYNGTTEGLPRVEIFGIWNEPDGSGLTQENGDHTSPQLYVDQILKPCVDSIRKARPDAKTAGPELTSETDYLKKVVEASGDSLDIITVHKYSDDPNRIISHMQSVRSIIEGTKKTKGKSIWLTETGWSTQSPSKCGLGSVDDNTQASRSKSLLSLIEDKNWIEKIFFYELRDDENVGCRWGMIRPDGSEKPWFGELKAYLKNQPPQPFPDVPGGSYRSSCRRERIENNILLAECKDKSSQWVSTRLASYSHCKDILNNNGKLVCISGDSPGPDHERSPPSGSYRNSCKNEEIRDGVLYASCKDRKGKLKSTKLFPYEPCHDIVNDNGNLVCK